MLYRIIELDLLTSNFTKAPLDSCLPIPGVYFDAFRTSVSDILLFFESKVEAHCTENIVLYFKLINYRSPQIPKNK